MSRTVKIFQVDAFTDQLFGGNPAAVCPLDQWLDDNLMQKIGAENNLSETVFFVANEDDFEIRWFTPTVEVDLCGHATLASAHVLFNELNYRRDVVTFHSPRSGMLKVHKENDRLTLDFPLEEFAEIEAPEAVIEGFGKSPVAVYKGKGNYLVIFQNQQKIERLQPDLKKLAELDDRAGVIASAKGNEADFVSRFFAPQSGIDEDPVTGSAHTTLTPYWAEKLGNEKLSAKQISQRGGDLICELKDDRVLISGKAVTYLRGEIFI